MELSSFLDDTKYTRIWSSPVIINNASTLRRCRTAQHIKQSTHLNVKCDGRKYLHITFIMQAILEQSLAGFKLTSKIWLILLVFKQKRVVLILFSRILHTKDSQISRIFSIRSRFISCISQVVISWWPSNCVHGCRAFNVLHRFTTLHMRLWHDQCVSATYYQVNYTTYNIDEMILRGISNVLCIKTETKCSDRMSTYRY